MNGVMKALDEGPWGPFDEGPWGPWGQTRLIALFVSPSVKLQLVVADPFLHATHGIAGFNAAPKFSDVSNWGPTQ